MKLYSLFLLFLTVSGCLFSQESSEQKLSEFEDLIIQGRFTVDIVYSDEMKAVAVKHAKEVDFENLSYTYSGKTLKIKYGGSLLDDVDLNLTLYINNLDYLEAKQGAEIRVKKDFDFQRKPVELKSDAGGKIAVTIDAPWIKAEITKGGSIRIEGKTPLLKAEIKTGGTIGAAHLEAKKVNAKISFGGEIICYPVETLDAQITSGGTISYKGNPEVEQKIRLGGTIEKI